MGECAMNKKTSKWELKDQPSKSDIQAIQAELNCSHFFAILCYQRGLYHKHELANFVSPKLDDLYNPYDLYEMDKAKERIESAIMLGEKITIYGDYDADGVTSTSIMLESLLMLGAEVDYYIPNRFEEGYGPNVAAFEKIINSGTQLIITVDNGVKGHEAIKRAADLGVDVVVTDHHELPDELPAAYAVIHPRHPKGNYPFGDLSGAGVAFKLATAILDEVPYELLDLAAIGTVADLVSLTDENRIIVIFGLEVLQQAQRPGILRILQLSDTKPDEVDETTIGFRIAPRLNAAGRMADATIAVKLLLAQDMETAMPIADKLEQLNQKRRQYVDKITASITDDLANKTSEYVNVIAGEGWHEGVIGIVASRIVDLTGKPTVILSINKEKGLAKGSGRSVAHINLFKVLNDASNLMTAFGGHQMAAGLTLPIENIANLRKQVNDYVARSYSDAERTNSLILDSQLKLADITVDTIKEMETLAPFGSSNPLPKVCLKNVTIEKMRKIGADKSHLKAVLSDRSSNVNVDAVGFGFGNVIDRLGSLPQIDIAATLNINEWNGKRKPQLMLEDIKVNETQIIDQRSRHFPSDIYGLTDTAYLFFNKQVYYAAKQIQGDDEHFYFYASYGNQSLTIAEKQLVLVDCPGDEQMIKQILANNEFQIIYAIFFSFKEVYLNGLGSKEEFAKVFRYLVGHKNIDYAHKRQELADYLQLNLNLLNFIISVFIEVGYVKMESGLLQPTKSYQPITIQDTETYQKREKLMQMEKKLLYSSNKELNNLLQAWIKAEE